MTDFNELLARARALVQEKEHKEAISNLQAQVATVDKVDIASLGAGTGDSPESQEAIIEAIQEMTEPTNSAANSTTAKLVGVARDDITLNTKQQLFCTTVLEGKDVVEVGAAGTGKTTSVRKTTRMLLDTPGRLPKMRVSTKWLNSQSPGATIVSFTRKAVNNIRHAVVDELKANTITLHKLLEYQPVFYEVEDPANPGMIKNTMRFEPTRNRLNPLPSDLQLIIFEESSMIGVELYALLQEAMPHPHQEVFLGDIQQLPPVFGLAILGFKMCDLEVIELTEVYRQALESPILDMAWKLLKGDATSFSSTVERFTDEKGKSRIRVPSYDSLSREAYKDNGEFIGSLKIQPWQKKLSPDLALATIVKQFKSWTKAGYYNPQEDIILCPHNVNFGTIEINLGIAQFLGEERDALVHEVIAGFNKHYLAVGDRVLYDKEDAFIVDIARNSNYLGKFPAPASKNLNRWGHIVKRSAPVDIADLAAGGASQHGVLEEDELLAMSAAQIEDRVQASSHVVVIRYAMSDGSDDQQDIVLDKAAEVNALLGGYCVTVHKYQGSEVENGFIVLHEIHAKTVSRELLYTATTRFKKRLHIICEPNTIERGIKSQRIKGDTLDEKKKLFRGKQVPGEGFAIEKTIKNGGTYRVTKYSPMEVDGRNHRRIEAADSHKTVDVDRQTNSSTEREDSANVQIEDMAQRSSEAEDNSTGSRVTSIETEADRKARLLAQAKAKLAELSAARKSKTL